MIGQRVDDDWDDGLPPEGAYWKNRHGVWFARTPNGLMANLANHNVVLHQDNTISVTPSILVTAYDGKWHGYLTRGQWVPVE